MHFLLIDPTETALKLIPYFLQEDLKVGITITKQYQTFDILKNIDTKVDFFDLNINSWNNELKITSAVSWSYSGARFLNDIGSQVALSNINTDLLNSYRISQYLHNIPIYENTVYFETLSYKGRHVLIGAFKFIDNQWKLYQDCNSKEFQNYIESAYYNLDSTGVINGPGQSFCFSDGTIKIKQHTANGNWIVNRNLVTRNFVDIWPTVVKNEDTNPKRSINKFYQWADSTGSSKRFKRCDAGKI